MWCFLLDFEKCMKVMVFFICSYKFLAYISILKLSSCISFLKLTLNLLAPTTVGARINP